MTFVDKNGEQELKKEDFLIEKITQICQINLKIININ